MSRRVVLWAGAWLVSGVSLSAQPLTEQDALQRMRAEYPAVRALRLQVREVEADARLRTLPTNPTVSYTREDAGLTVDDFLLVSQELPWRGRRRLLHAVADRQVDVAEAGADASIRAVESDLRLVFTDLLVAQERSSVLESGIHELAALASVLVTREAEGEGSRFDRLRVEREVAEVEADLAATHIGRDVARTRLASFFRPGTAAATLSAAGSLDARRALPGTTAAAAVGQRADYRALRLDEARWDAERRAAERLRLPSASLAGGIKRARTAGSSDTGYAVTAAVNVPIFSRGDSQLIRADAGRARAAAQREVLAGQITADVDAARVTAIQYQKLADRYQADSVGRATALVAIATAAYEEGEYGILELLDAHQITLQTRLRQIALSAAARRGAIALDRALGRQVTP